MTRVDTSQMLNRLMHVQMNQPMGATRYKNICMEKKKTQGTKLERCVLLIISALTGFH